MQRPGSAECQQGELPRVATPLDRDDAKGLGDLRLCHSKDPVGAVQGIQAE